MKGKDGIWMTPVQLLITIGFFIVMLAVIIPLTGTLLGKDVDEESAREAFNALADTLESVAEKGEKYASDDVLYSLPSGYALAGFDTESEEISYTDSGWLPWSEDKSKVERPGQCIRKACLVLYNDEGNVMDFRIFYEEDYGEVTFSAYLPGVDEGVGLERNDISDELERKYLLYSGSTTGGEGERQGSRLFASGYFHVEKLEREGLTHFLVSPLLEELSDREGTFLKCPESSDDVCEGEPRGELVEFEGEMYECLYQGSWCSAREVSVCEEGENVAERCICGEQVADFNDVCYEGETYEFDCTGVTSCEDYCSSDTPGDYAGDNCLPKEQELCKKNPCGVETGCDAKIVRGEVGGKAISCVSLS